MCGIAGVLTKSPEGYGSWLKGAADDLGHRGPDDIGVAWVTANGFVMSDDVGLGDIGTLGLAHRRLSIIDLSAAGRQPMLSRGRKSAMSFNGEIYNFKELRRDRLAGVSFRGNSDSEVLLELFDAMGSECLTELKGMFAFAHADWDTGKLTLARDCFGIKPLYVSVWATGIAFCSEIGPLLELPSVGRKVDAQVAYDFMRFAIADNGETSLFPSIRQVPPGCFWEIDLREPSAVREVRYWEPYRGDPIEVSFEEASEGVRERFLQSVRLHLRSDVEVGAALSGGIDSSAIVCAMRHLEPGMAFKTFCYAPQGFRYNEEPHARLVAKACGAELVLVDFDSEELARHLDQLLLSQGEPILSPSVYAQACVFRRAREMGVVVMLEGQGADEIFGGYPRYYGVRLAGMIRRGEWARIWRLLKLGNAAGGGLWRGWLMAGEHVLPRGCKRLARRWVKKPLWYDFYNKDWFLERGVGDGRLESPMGEDGLRGYLRETLVKTNLPQLLHYGDRNSMAVSLENRVPFLQTDLVDYALSLPEEYLVGNDGTMKSVLRSAMRGLVPDAILDRRDKIGFQPPEHALLKDAQDWIGQVLEDAEGLPMLHLDRLRDAWRAAREREFRADSAIWRALMFVRWATLMGISAD